MIYQQDLFLKRRLIRNGICSSGEPVSTNRPQKHIIAVSSSLCCDIAQGETG